MPNEVLYVDQTISVNGSSEQLSVNGYTTGQAKGTPTQADNETAQNEDSYYTERGIVRYGTMMGDNANGSTPTIGVKVEHKLTKCSVDDGDSVYAKNGAKTFTYTADTDYELPATVTVKIGGTTATVNTDYTWTVGTGKLVFAANKLSGNTEITVVATAAE